MERVGRSAVTSLDVVDWAEMSLREQLLLAAQTDVLVGDHGAGLSHMALMAKDRIVVELTNALMNELDYFAVVAELLELRYLKVFDSNLTADVIEAALMCE